MNTKNHQISASCKRVANYLKCLINQNCKDGFLWYPEASTEEGVSIFDLNYAIEVLEGQKDKILTISED